MRRELNSYRKEKMEKHQQHAIQHLQQNLANKKQELLDYKKSLVNAKTEIEQKTFQFRIEHTQRVIIKIQIELEKKGVTEKRGRPKKKKVLPTKSNERNLQLTYNFLPLITYSNSKRMVQSPIFLRSSMS